MPVDLMDGGAERAAGAAPEFAPEFAIDILGERRAARLVRGPMLDPAGERMRG